MGGRTPRRFLMSSKRRLESYLMIDHTAGAPGPSIAGPYTRKGLYETATLTCHMCQAQIILRPERSRDRAWCWKHDKYLCDRCAVVAKVRGCKPMSQVLDEMQTQAHMLVARQKEGIS